MIGMPGSSSLDTMNVSTCPPWRPATNAPQRSHILDIDECARSRQTQMHDSGAQGVLQPRPTSPDQNIGRRRMTTLPPAAALTNSSARVCLAIPNSSDCKARSHPRCWCHPPMTATLLRWQKNPTFRSQATSIRSRCRTIDRRHAARSASRQRSEHAWHPRIADATSDTGHVTRQIDAPGSGDIHRHETAPSPTAPPEAAHDRPTNQSVPPVARILGESALTRSPIQ